jgi:hypothetical protein
MDGVALASVITSGALGAATASIAVWTARQSAKLAKEQRVQQRSADGYLQVLRLAEQEAQWLDSCVHNFGLDHQDLYYGAAERIDVPRPAVADRATASAVLAAFGSTAVRARHAEWRSAADAFSELVNNIIIGLHLSDDPHETVSDESMKTLTEDLQPKERAARQALAEAVASELGHR